MKYLLVFLFLSFTNIPDRMLVMGDSISVYSYGWQEKLCKEKGLECVNIAKGAMRTDWMLKTLRGHLEKDHNYKQVIIYGGINDVYSNIKIDTIILHVQQMVDLVDSYGIKAIVIVGYDGRIANQNTWVKDKVLEKKIHDDYVVYQNRLAREIQNAYVVPIIPIDEKDLADGIHLSAKGHRTYVSYLRNCIF